MSDRWSNRHKNSEGRVHQTRRAADGSQMYVAGDTPDAQSETMRGTISAAMRQADARRAEAAAARAEHRQAQRGAFSGPAGRAASEAAWGRSRAAAERTTPAHETAMRTFDAAAALRETQDADRARNR